LTELLISGFFDGLSPSEIAAVLSSFVQDDRSTTERRKVTNPKLRQKLDEMIDRQKGMVKVY
jgi:superfamily II RNA helicase